MALSDDKLWDLWNAQGTDDMSCAEAFVFARAIEAEARRDALEEAAAAVEKATPTPQADGQPQARAVPLTPEAINVMAREYPAEDLCGWSYRMGVADAEAHHGIKGGQQ